MSLRNSVSQFGFKSGLDSISDRDSRDAKRASRSFARCGYTLLELLLALGLTVAIVSIIATAIRVNGLTLTRVQASIERKQAARSILGIVQNDLRAGIQYKANQYAGLKDLFESIRLARGQAAALDANQSTPSGTTYSDDGSQTGSSEEGSDTRDATAASVGTAVSSASAAPNSTGSQSSSSNSSPFTVEEFEEPDADSAPLFIGESNFVSIDVSRLPRIDQYHPAIRTAEESLATLADVKTVSYFVSSENGSSRSSGNATQLGQLGQLGVGPTVTGGLFRREIDRSIAVHQGLQGVQGPDEYSQVVAAEVVEIAFRYFDGESWSTSWDSEDRGGFPIAVEVMIWVDPLRIDNSVPPQDVADRDNLEVYRSVVHIPVAEVIEEDEDEN